MTDPGDIGAGLGDLLSDCLTAPSLPSHIYFHVPFCRSKCAYCDFYSMPTSDEGLPKTVFTAMRAEIDHWASACLPGVVETVYFGGGTPSLFPDLVADLLGEVRDELPLRCDAEITVEANPDSLDADGLELLVEAGVNRVSVGVQSFDDEQLAFLGRLHDRERAVRVCEMVAGRGLELSVDIMCGVTGGDEGLTKLAQSLQAAVDCGAKHVSVYPLQVEEGTPLARLEEQGRVEIPDSDVAAEQMLLASEKLAHHGFGRYEVANYALPGHEARHNTAYWLGRQYLGIGPAAHSMFDCQTASLMGFGACSPESRVRVANPADVEAWLVGNNREVEFLSAAEARREDIMLGMRLAVGVSQKAVELAGLAPVFEELRAQGLVERAGGSESARWRCTSRGWLLGNEVFGRIWNAGDEA